MIRTNERIFQAISHDQILDDETLLTFLIETEKIINNRPLCALSDNHQDLDVLTPNKILMLKNNDSYIITEFSGNQYLRQWRRVCILSQTFRKRWVRGYLSSLHNRQKCRKNCRNLKVGDLFMVMSENTNSISWPLGVVTDVAIQSGGLVRDVTVKTSKGLIRRDVLKLGLLEGANK